MRNQCGWLGAWQSCALRHRQQSTPFDGLSVARFSNHREQSWLSNVEKTPPAVPTQDNAYWTESRMWHFGHTSTQPPPALCRDRWTVKLGCLFGSERERDRGREIEREGQRKTKVNLSSPDLHYRVRSHNKRKNTRTSSRSQGWGIRVISTWRYHDHKGMASLWSRLCTFMSEQLSYESVILSTKKAPFNFCIHTPCTERPVNTPQWLVMMVTITSLILLTRNNIVSFLSLWTRLPVRFFYDVKYHCSSFSQKPTASSDFKLLPKGLIAWGRRHC